jgi:phage-related tail protein
MEAFINEKVNKLREQFQNIPPEVFLQVAQDAWNRQRGVRGEELDELDEPGAGGPRKRKYRKRATRKRKYRKRATRKRKYRKR